MVKHFFVLDYTINNIIAPPMTDFNRILENASTSRQVRPIVRQDSGLKRIPPFENLPALAQ